MTTVEDASNVVATLLVSNMKDEADNDHENDVDKESPQSKENCDEAITTTTSSNVVANNNSGISSQQERQLVPPQVQALVQSQIKSVTAAALSPPQITTVRPQLQPVHEQASSQTIASVAGMVAPSTSMMSSLPFQNNSRKAERLEQNRISARESRKRKKSMIEELQRTVIALTSENNELNGRNQSLRSQLTEIGRKHPNVVSIQAVMNSVPNPSPRHQHQQQQQQPLGAMIMAPNYLQYSKQQQHNQRVQHPDTITAATTEVYQMQMPIPIVASASAPVPPPFQMAPPQQQQIIAVASTMAAPVSMIPAVIQAAPPSTMKQQHTMIAPQPSSLASWDTQLKPSTTIITTQPKVVTVQEAPTSTTSATTSNDIPTTATTTTMMVPDPMAVAATSETVIIA